MAFTGKFIYIHVCIAIETQRFLLKCVILEQKKKMKKKKMIIIDQNNFNWRSFCSKKTLRLNSILRDFLQGFSVLYYGTWEIIFSMNTALRVFYQPQNVRKFKYSQPPTKVAGFCKICILCIFTKKQILRFQESWNLKKIFTQKLAVVMTKS